MDVFLVSNVAFFFTLYKVKPASIVDKAIEIFLDIVVPGRGAGENNALMKGWRSLEQSAERKQREIDIRRDLRKWDEEYPELHHELIVRYLAGAAASFLVTTIYNAIRGHNNKRRYN